MNSGDNDRNIESKLASALDDAARQTVPGNRQPPPYARLLAHAEPRRSVTRGRWLTPVLAGVLVVAVITVATLLARSMSASRSEPANRQTAPTPQTLPAPIVPITPSPRLSLAPTRPATPSAPRRSAPTTTATSETTPPATATMPSVAPSLRITVHGIGLTVPAGWNALGGPPTAEGSTGSTCLYDLQTRCALLVLGGSEPTGAKVRLDQPISTNGVCNWNRTVFFGQRIIGGRSAEYRRFSGNCGTAEQWGLASSPDTYVFHQLGVDDADIANVLAGVRIPNSIAPQPGFDVGYLKAIIKSGLSYRVTLQRAVRSADLQRVIYGNEATYSFIASNSAVGDFWCSSWRIPGYVDGKTCTIDQVMQQAAKGPKPSDGSLALSAVLVMEWSDNGVVQTLRDDRSFPGG